MNPQGEWVWSDDEIAEGDEVCVCVFNNWCKLVQLEWVWLRVWFYPTTVTECSCS